MQENPDVVNPETHNYHFDRAACLKANFTQFNHDYKPVHPRINVPFTQDLTEELMAHKKSLFSEEVDPYLPIADLRRLFEGKGRKLAGFQILVKGVRGPITGEKHTVKKHPPFKDLRCSQLLSGVAWDNLDEYGVNHMVCMHLSYYMAFCERMLAYYDTCAYFQEEIATNSDPDRVAACMRTLKAFRKSTCITDNQWDVTKAKKFVSTFPNISLQREALMLPGKVHFPMEISWATLELAIKDTLEKGVSEKGYIGYGMVDIIACDQDGAITSGHGIGGYDSLSWAENGNAAYHMTLQDDMLIVMAQDFSHHAHPHRELKDYLWHAYDGFQLDYYMGRKRVPKDAMYYKGFSEEVNAAMRMARRDVQAHFKEKGEVFMM